MNAVEQRLRTPQIRGERVFRSQRAGTLLCVRVAVRLDPSAQAANSAFTWCLPVEMGCYRSLAS